MKKMTYFEQTQIDPLHYQHNVKSEQIISNEVDDISNSSYVFMVLFMILFFGAFIMLFNNLLN